MGDFNGDGLLDIVTANAGANTVSVLLNTTAHGSTTASFTAHQGFSIGSSNTGLVAVGDFNGDGKPDIVIANLDSNTVSVLLNNGNGTFAAHQDFAVGSGPFGVAVGDFNSDGLLDIVTANFNGNNATVLLQSPLVVHVETIQVSQNVLFSGPIAVITGANGMPTVTINWGDNASSQGTVSQNLDGSLTVSGSHTYTQTGPFTLTVTATEDIFTSQGIGQALVQVPLAVQVNTIQASANVLFNGPVATISGANMASDTAATINWGDGFPSTTGTISGSGNTLTVSGSHIYSQGGTFTLTVTATEGTRSAQGTGQAIAQPALAVEVDTIQPVATVLFSGAVAIISGATSTSDTMATIIWGDNMATPGTIVANPDGTLTVSGTHTYATAGPFTLTVTATEGSRNAQGTGQALVQVPLAIQVSTIQASANVSFSGPVATISGANSASDTTATINWGDGTPATQGTISGSGNTLTVNGGHMYSQGGTFTLTVSAAEGTRSAHSSGQAIVHPALAVEVATIQAAASLPFSGVVAIISGVNSATDTTATINWGDGSASTAATVVANPDGTLTVSGRHTYATVGPFHLTVSATEASRSAQDTGQAIVQAPLIVQVNTIQATATFPFSGPIATITGANNAGDTTVTIYWGDGTSSSPDSLSTNPDGSLTVNGTHTYSNPGTFPLTVTATEVTRTGQGTCLAKVRQVQTLTIDDSVHGDDCNQFHYVGEDWDHCTGGCDGDTSGLYNGSYSWDDALNEYVTITFSGRQIVFYGVKDPRHGIGAVSIDGGSESKIDFYAATRAGDVPMYTSPILPAGTHTFKLRVTRTKNPNSSDFFVTVDRVNILS